MIPISKPYLGEEEVKAASDVIRSGWVTQGPKVKELEDAFSNYVGSSYACAVSNCTAALHLSLLACGVKPGDNVITVSHSFIATANSIRYCQAEPIFIDIDSRTYNMSVDLLKDLLENKQKTISAILVAHQIGMPCEIQSIVDTADKFDIPVIEDAACAIGSEVSMDSGNSWDKIGKPHGKIACFSFHPRKVITTGEGGMVTTNDEEIDKKLRLLRHQGMSMSDLKRHKSDRVVFEEYPEVGFNYRMSDIQAAIGVEQLKKLPEIISIRRDIADKYKEGLSSIEWLEVPGERQSCKSNWQSYAVKVKDGLGKNRDEVMQKLLDEGISSRRGIMNSHQESPYAEGSWVLPESEKARDNVILLPMHCYLTGQDVDKIVSVLKGL